MSISSNIHIGSKTAPYLLEISGTTYVEQRTVVAAGTECRLDHILVGTSDGVVTDLLITVQTVGGVTLGIWQIDPTNAAMLKRGLSCGPRGIHSDDGLLLIAEDLTTTGGDCQVTVLYGEGTGYGVAWAEIESGSTPQHVSQAVNGSAGTATVALVAAGTRCVFDGISPGGDSAGNSIDFDVQTANGAQIHKYYDLDTTGKIHTRNAPAAGPYGMSSEDGLQIVLTNNDAGANTVTFTALYREIG